MTTKVTSYFVEPFILFVLAFAVTGGFNPLVIGVLWQCFAAVVVIGMFFWMLSAFGDNRNLTGTLLGVVQLAIVYWMGC